MKNKLFVLLVTAGVMVSGATAYAHHSFGATYIVEKQVTLEGNVVQISYRSPHSFFFIDVPDPNGPTQKWSIEGAAPGQLAEAGVARDTFKVGDHVIVVANPARSTDSYRGRMIKITRPSDGKSWGGRAGEVVD
jgi:hypothetical protein